MNTTAESLYGDVVAGRGGPLAAPVRGALWLASIGYRALISARNRRYDRDPSTVQSVSVPVISVGNVTTGGTGKTPMVVDISARLTSLGRRPAVVSRGYRAERGRRSDELMMIERAVPGAICVGNADRIAGAQEAIECHGADVIVLDDGFQHRRMGRDLDIVLIDATRPFGQGHMLPRGYLREPPGNVARADLLVITRCDQVDSSNLGRLMDQIRGIAGDKPQLTSVHRPQPLRGLGLDHHPMSGRPAGPAYLMSGIANHDAFQQTVESMGIRVCGHAKFPDHHPYRESDVGEVCRQAVEVGAGFVILTEKDAVKLELLTVKWPLEVRVLDVRIDFQGDHGKILDGFLAGALAVAS